MTLSPGKFRGMRAMENDSGHFTMLAVDQRPPLKALCANARGENRARYEDMRALKRCMLETLSPHASAVLADPTYALADALQLLQPQTGMIVTLADSPSPRAQMDASPAQSRTGRSQRSGLQVDVR